jgi:hypothetical protein
MLCLDIEFGSLDCPNIVAGYNSTYHQRRGAMRKKSVKSASLDMFGPDFSGAKSYLTSLSLELFGRPFEQANRDYLGGAHIRELCARAGVHGLEAVEGAKKHFEMAETPHAAHLMKNEDLYYPPHNPCPMFVLVMEWRRRSWDITHLKWVFRSP